jgi:glycosyltransferase EpsE
MTDKVKVSVLMGIYNCASTLEEAINCIIKQTYTEWELIICDDGSMDNSYEIAKKMADKDNRIFLIKNKFNMGLSATLNHCLEYANGEFIARMDGDDICSHNRFKLEIDTLIKNPQIAVVGTGMTFFDEAGLYGKALFPEYPSVFDIFRTTPFCHASIMMRTKILKQLNGYRTDKEVERIEDYDLWVRLYSSGYQGYNIQDYLYSMRDDRAAIKRKKFSNRVNEYRLKIRICKLFDLSLKYKILSLRPIILGILPRFIYQFLHRTRLKLKR